MSHARVSVNENPQYRRWMEEPQIAFGSVGECDRELVNCSKLLRTVAVKSRPMVLAHADEVLDRRLDLVQTTPVSRAAA